MYLSSFSCGVFNYNAFRVQNTQLKPNKHIVVFHHLTDLPLEKGAYLENVYTFCIVKLN